MSSKLNVRDFFFFQLFFLFLAFIPPVLVQATEPIRFGILSIAPPARIHAKWQPFVRYVSKQLGHEVKIVVPRGFKKMKAAAAAGKVDFFYVNSHVFYRLKQAGKAIDVGQMENITGSITSTSDIFVRNDSDIKTVEDLKGKSIAFVSPMGAGGYLAPRAYMYAKGVKTKNQTKEVFTKNLSNSIHQVLLGDINAGTMCGVNYKLMGKKMDTGELRIIGKSSPYPENVIAARSTIDKTLMNNFKKVVISMPDSIEGQKVLILMHSMKIKRFLAYDVKSEELTKKLLSVGQF